MITTNDPPVSVYQLAERALRLQGFDGLWNFDGDCACVVGYLSPHECMSEQCIPGYRGTCPPECGCGGLHMSDTQKEGREMAKYRKKPVVIEAFEMTEARRWDNSEWPEWLHMAWNKDASEVGALYPDPDAPIAIGRESAAQLIIRTLEGPVSIAWTDRIIKGVQDELYPCKADIFEATYE